MEFEYEDMAVEEKEPEKIAVTVQAPRPRKK
jgi:hypothetical protein